MLQLPNGAKCSKLSVFPKNWETPAATLNQKWYIKYRFTDSAGNTKQVVIKRMNSAPTLKGRRKATKLLLSNEMSLLQHEGFNPITGTCNPPVILNYVIEPTTPFSLALEHVLHKLKIEPKTKQDISYIVKRCKQAAMKLDCNIAIQDIRRRHVKMILEHIEAAYPTFTDNTFNTYHKYLRILFAELMELDAVDCNPVKDLKKRRLVEKERVVLTKEERKFLDEYLGRKYPAFHRYLQIFFHSGGRISEHMRMTGKDVDLKNQRYRTVVMKGKRRREVWRVIKDIALPFWEKAMEFCGPEDYVFSEGLVPGPKPIQPFQITKRWYRLVKRNPEVQKHHKITANFNRLKHSNTTEVVDALNEEAAAAMNAHTTTGMVVRIYDTKQKDRNNERIKKVHNPF